MVHLVNLGRQINDCMTMEDGIIGAGLREEFIALGVAVVGDCVGGSVGAAVGVAVGMRDAVCCRWIFRWTDVEQPEPGLIRLISSGSVTSLEPSYPRAKKVIPYLGRQKIILETKKCEVHRASSKIDSGRQRPGYSY